MSKRIPTLFGCPLWMGKIKKRVAKKYLNRWSIGYIAKHNLAKFSKLGVRDLINDCSGFNVEITKVNPEYVHVGKGKVLIDITFDTDGGSCSLTHCGIESELSREEVEKQHVEFLQSWFNSGDAATWYGGEDSSDYKLRLAAKNKKMDILQRGGHITDERGKRLPEVDIGL